MSMIRKELWNNYIQLIENYLEDCFSGESSVINYENAQNLKEKLKLSLDSNGCSDKDILEEIKKYLHYTPQTLNPHFNNQLSAGTSFEAILGELASIITNSTMSTFEVSPVATLIENKLADELCELIGYEDGEGLMLTGGSNANMLAMHVARDHKFHEVKSSGMQGLELCMFVSDQAHYSFKKATMLMGLGLDNLICVKSDGNGRMLASDLEDKIQTAISLGKKPFFVASTCGTTVKGAFDPILDIQQICDKYELWHHIDGAWGGATLYSKEKNSYLPECEKADSFTFDAHKLLGTGLITSFLLTKNKGLIKSANCGGGSEYLFHPYENADYDLGPGSLQCGRKNDALKLWLVWKSLGHKGLQELVDNQIYKAELFRELVESRNELNLIFEPEYLNVCFQVKPSSAVDINEFNLKLRFQFVQNGQYLVNYTTDPDGLTYFRMVFANHHVELEHCKMMINDLIDLASKIDITT